MNHCEFKGCKEKNKEWYALTRDDEGYHWFCSHHWKFISFLFNNIVMSCCRAGKCRRNHHADLDPKECNPDTVKFDGRYYDMCGEHLSTYHELVELELALPDFQD